jgi:pyrroline-5-carboxylate reductase
MNKITIIGAGNMGGAAAMGFSKAVSNGCLQAEITVTAAHQASLARFENLGLHTSLDNLSAASGAAMLIIAVKPWLVKPVLTQIHSVLQGVILVSFAAGISSDELMGLAGGAAAVYKVIPNLAAEVCESMTFVTKLSGSEDSDKRVKAVFDSIGKTRFVDDRQLSAATMVASCGTAYALRYIRASVEGGVELGMYPKDALEAVLQTVKGAADLLESRGTHPEQEIDRVTTPGGITIRGLNSMEENGFTNAVIKGLKI